MRMNCCLGPRPRCRGRMPTANLPPQDAAGRPQLPLALFFCVCRVCFSLSSYFFFLTKPRIGAIRQSDDVKITLSPNTQHKIGLFANNILSSFFYTNPLHFYQKQIKLMQTFSSMSNHSINWHKSSILSQHRSRRDVATPTQPLPLCTGHITYLGIHIKKIMNFIFISFFHTNIKK